MDSVKSVSLDYVELVIYVQKCLVYHHSLSLSLYVRVCWGEGAVESCLKTLVHMLVFSSYQLFSC